MRSNTHPALWGLMHSVDSTPPGEPEGGGTPPTDSAPAGGEQGGDGAPTKEDIEKLTRALNAERARARQFEAQLKEAAQQNPELMREAQARAEAAERQRELIEQQAALRVQDLQRKHEEQMANVRSELQERTAKAEREALRVKAQAEFLASEGQPEASRLDGRTPFDYIWQVFGHRYAEGEGGLYLMGAGGTPELDEDGKPKTLRKHYAELSTDPVHGVHFKPKYGSGSGSRGGRDGRVMSGQDMAGMTSKDLISEGLKELGGRRR
jgi:hypothetical protein